MFCKSLNVRCQFVSAVLMVLLSNTSYSITFDPPFPLFSDSSQTEINTSRDGDSLHVEYRTYDPEKGQWVESSTTYNDGSQTTWSSSNVRNVDGVVFWVASEFYSFGETRYTEKTWVNCAVYDPELGSWKKSQTDYNGDNQNNWTIYNIGNQKGCISWTASLYFVFGETRYTPEKHVNFIVYDSEQGQWVKQTRSYSTTGDHIWWDIDMINTNGIVSWEVLRYEDYGSPARVDKKNHNFIYDPERAAWKEGLEWDTSTLPSTNFYIEDEYVHFRFDELPVRRWYNPDSGGWRSGSAPNWTQAYASLDEGKWLHVAGDRIENNLLYDFDHQYMMFLNLNSGSLEGLYVDFITDRDFSDVYPSPASVTGTSSKLYHWEFPDLTMLPNSPVHLALENTVLDTTGFTFERTVDQPLLVDDSVTQTMEVSLTFDQSLPQGTNNLTVRLGRFAWNEGMVTEAIFSQNDVTGWNKKNDGSWTANSWDISIGTTYTFVAQITCSKSSSGMVYHKPQAFLSMSDRQYGLWDHGGSEATFNHPLGETATYQSDTSTIQWDRAISQNRRDVFLEEVTIPVDDTGVSINKINISYGRGFDHESTGTGYEFNVNVEGSNIVAATMTTPNSVAYPAGRKWDMEIDEDEIDFDISSMTPQLLTDMGIVTGMYQFGFKDYLDTTTTTSVFIDLTTPTQIPLITFPVYQQTGVDVNPLVQWTAITDPAYNMLVLVLSNDEETWEREIWDVPVESTTYHVQNVPPEDGIKCFIAGGETVTGTTPQGIDYQIIHYNRQITHFFTGPLYGDFDDDEDVDLYDFGRLSANWLQMDCGLCDEVDMTGDSNVNLEDLMVFSDYWLTSIVYDEGN